MSFQFHALDHQQFVPFYGLSDQELAEHGISADIVECPAGFPCRVSLTLPEPGERVLLLNYAHLDVDSPYRSRHAIYIRDGQRTEHFDVGQIPEMFNLKRVAVRGLSNQHHIKAGEMVQGEQELRLCIERLLNNPDIAYLHLHSPTHGCFLATVSRAAVSSELSGG